MQTNPIEWRDGELILLDQRRLPDTIEYLRLDTAPQVRAAIEDMVVRGAPAIGVTAAYGVVLAARAAYAESPTDWRDNVVAAIADLGEARPTAVNLRWALAQMQAALPNVDPVPTLLATAERIHRKEIAANIAMGEHGANRIAKVAGSGTSGRTHDGVAVITHCNTGALATGGSGTAFSVITTAYRHGQIAQVFACETRPWLQGSRLTAWELKQNGVPFELLVDSAAAYLMKVRHVDWVIVGADRIAANGDVANKIGTYGLANAARRHKVGMMVVAPTSTIDLATPSGDAIPLETRSSDEVLGLAAARIAPPGSAAWNPVFDVTEAGLIDVIVTEKGVIDLPNAAKIREHLQA
jgi:methylthioribose-1-phosphate isomerase